MEQVVLDLIPAGAKGVCHVSQNDIGRTIRFNLVSGGTVYTLAGTETIKVHIKKPDGTTAERNIANTSSTYVDWVTGEGDCDVAGKNECELIITSGTTVIGSKNFTMKVEEDPYNGQGVVIETASGNPAVFDTNIVDLFVEIKCSVNAIQEGTPWIDSNVVEKEPYNFRKVAGTASRIGNHLFDKLVGGTVAFNQLISVVDLRESQVVNDVTATNNNNGSFTLSGNANADGYIPVTYGRAFIENHVYFIGAGNSSHIRFSSGYPADGYNIVKWSRASGNGTIYLRVLSGDAFNDIVYIQKIDLTAMFGNTIADYIYSLEQATAGAGVAFFRKLFPKDYYAYNASELMSVKTTTHKLTGKNLAYRTIRAYTGGVAPYTVAIDNDSESVIFFATKGKTYTVSSSVTMNRSAIVQISSPNPENHEPCLQAGTVTTNTWVAEWTGWTMWYKVSTLNTDFENSAQVEIGSTATAYEPYIEHSYPLDDVELRGLFKLDSNNKLYADGDTYESSGDVGRKYGYLLINGQNTLNYNPNGTTANTSKCYIPIPLKKNGEYNFICTRFSFNSADVPYTVFGRASLNGVEFSLPHDVPQVGTDLRSWFASNPTAIVFELDTPTTETADPFTNPQQVDANGTEEYVDNRSVAIPAGHETYYADIYDISGFTACEVSIKDGSNVEQKSATISFGQTVYDGILEHKNGAWTFTGTHSIAVLSALNWAYESSTPRFISSDLASVIKAPATGSEQPNGACSCLEVTNFNRIYTNADGILAISTQGNLSAKCISCTSVEAFVANMAGQKLKYELATPFTLTLTGAQLETLLGENRVSHNCNGDTEVKYLYNA